MTVIHPWPTLPGVAMPLARVPAARALAGGVLLDVLAPATDAAGPVRQFLNLRAGMAELVLLNRLRARTRRELSQETLERAARIIEVTAHSWLGGGTGATAATVAADAADAPQEGSAAGGRAAA